MTKITIVNEKDEVIGAEEKKVAQEKGSIHRIVRVLLFNAEGQVFLQKRSPDKDSWPNRWDQSVGGHVEEGESYLEAALREMKEELGITDVNLKEITKFYTEENHNGLVLRRFNMLYKVTYDGKINLGRNEISKGDWFSLDYIANWMKEKPDNFPPACVETFRRYWESKKQYP